MTDPIEAMCRAHARVDGLDWDEVCGLEADPLGECDSGTCIAALNEDHDASYARAVYRQQATASYNALREALVPVGWRYDCTNPVGDRNHLDPTFLRLGRRANMDPRFWTETPLYLLPEIKP